MGLITGLLTIPLAPVRGVTRIAEEMAKQAEREVDGDESRVWRELTDLQRRRAFRTVDDAEYADREQALLAELENARARRRAHGVERLDEGAETESQ